MTTAAGRVPDVSELADRAAIEEILALHCRGVDRADEAALKHCYWPDATTAYGEAAVLAHPFCSQLVSAIKAYRQTHHMVTNSLFVFDGDRAKVETILLAFHYMVNDDGDDNEMTYLGRYLDDFEKRDHVWKIKHREPIMSWSQNGSATHDADHPALSALRRAKRYPDDPIYETD
ncbi:nuclear transport factor 2 family protein [Parasphingorhabdus cellanae]|uniref:Nuclear transport factor 2 family protein n=1 Tax=Parasphingorhabdus cellanae TaxID=2806553 RepID=A0ABX7T737_9SPHN|nr:nuclear transport factor 2 family protein [Parasphingorhabdus cellanae]QTD57414.1 nuclear transport factor 2 family protein [Parasphingorhabdus cellanae]